jgi:hypothetical protein
VEPSNESEVTGSENELPHRSSHAQFITSVAYEQHVIATKDEGLSLSTKINIKIVLCRMHNAKQSLAYIEARRNALPLVRAAEKHFGSSGPCMLPASIPNYTISIICAEHQ